MKDSTLSESREATGSNSRVKTYLCKMKGIKCQELPRVSWPSLLVTAAGSLIGLGLVTFLSAFYNLPLLFPSLGASAVLLYAACHVPMAQPRNVLGGHVFSALAGVLAYQILGGSWWVITVGVTAAIVVMVVTHTLHPPGGATAFVAVYNGQDFGFIIAPVGVGVACLIIIAVLVNNLVSERKYPEYWL